MNPEGNGEGAGLRRDAGIIGLLFASIGGIIGSGWLFGPLNAAKVAGPASIIAWIIGGVAVLLLAFVYAELTTAFPRSGAVVAFPKLSHGNLMAVVMSWVVFLAYVTVPPAEVIGVLTYANNYVAGLVDPHTGVLTSLGFIVALVLLIIFLSLNLLGIRWVLAVNSTLVWWKIVIPVLTVIALLLSSFHASNITAHGFAPTGLPGILSAVSTTGIVFSYLGFRQAIELAGETRNPRRTLPIAILGSVIICIVIYIGLQAAFIYAVDPASIAGGWAKLSFKGVAGPFAGLATLAGLSWLSVLLYIDAFVSPAGTGIIYCSTTARVVYATGKEGLMTQAFAKVSGPGVPWVALLVTLAFSVFFFFPFPSWQTIVGYISSVSVLSYGIGPVVLFTLRRTLPVDMHPRPFLLRGAAAIAPLSFIVSNLIVYWSGATNDNFMFGMLAVFFVLFIIWELATKRSLDHLQWRGAWWLAPYFFGMWLLTYIGPKALTGGTGLMGEASGMLAVAIFSVVILFVARASGIPDPEEARATILAGEPPMIGQAAE